MKLGEIENDNTRTFACKEREKEKKRKRERKKRDPVKRESERYESGKETMRQRNSFEYLIVMGRSFSRIIDKVLES